MMRTTLAATLSFVALSAPAVAAPTGSLNGARPASSVEQAAYRHCWWHHGHRHCRYVYRDYDGPYYGYGPYYGFGPSVGFYFGRGSGWHGGHHRHR